MVAAPAKAAPCGSNCVPGVSAVVIWIPFRHFFATTTQQIPSLQAPDGLLRGPKVLEEPHGKCGRRPIICNPRHCLGLAKVLYSDYLAAD